MFYNTHSTTSYLVLAKRCHFVVKFPVFNSWEAKDLTKGSKDIFCILLNQTKIDANNEK